MSSWQNKSGWDVGPVSEHSQTQRASGDPEVPISKQPLQGAGLPRKATGQITATPSADGTRPELAPQLGKFC